MMITAHGNMRLLHIQVEGPATAAKSTIHAHAQLTSCGKALFGTLAWDVVRDFQSVCPTCTKRAGTDAS